MFSKSFFPKIIRECNNLSDEIKRPHSVNSFKNKLKSIYGPSDAKAVRIWTWLFHYKPLYDASRPEPFKKPPV